MAAETPADLIRRAAALMRQRAEAATDGPWRAHDTYLSHGGYTATVLSGEGNGTELRAWLPTFSNETSMTVRNVYPDAEHIASWHPLVGLAVADWLDSWEDFEFEPDSSYAEDHRAAVKVARVYLAEVSGA